MLSDAGLREEEGYSYLCRADYTNEGEYVPGDEVMIKNTGTGLIICYFEFGILRVLPLPMASGLILYRKNIHF